MDSLLGNYKALKDIPTHMGFSVFTIPKGAIVVVKQHDKRGRKVLIEAGPQFIDWKHINFLKLFESI